MLGIVASCLPSVYPTHSTHPPRTAIQYVLDIAGKVQAILEGSPAIDPMAFGWTTEEEQSAATGGNVRA